MKSDDILIIGAGAAGLTGAHKLIAAGFKVTVLEGRNRVGGQIHTIRGLQSTTLEAGPEFVHGNVAEMQKLLASVSSKTDSEPRGAAFSHLVRPSVDFRQEP